MKRSHAPVRIGPAWLGAGGKWGFPLPRDPLDLQGKVQFALHYDVILLFYNDNVTSINFSAQETPLLQVSYLANC